MAQLACFVFFLAAVLFLDRSLGATPGEADPVYKACVEQCQMTGCIHDECFSNCNFVPDQKPSEGRWNLQEPLYLRWKDWHCRSDCRYHCMLIQEERREKLGDKPIKYYGKWPFKRVLGIQEPVSVALSTLNLGLAFHGWVSFFILVYYKLPLTSNGKTLYEYTGLWHVYGILSMNSWLWSAVFHGRFVELTERLYYSSTLAFLGFELILSILRTFKVRSEATRVMVAAPLIAFMTTHILYLNLVEFNYGLNMVVVIIIVAARLLVWATWACLSQQSLRWKLFVVVFGGALAMLLEIVDFPPYKGLIDAHALWQVITAPLTYIWWSFIRDDAEFTTSTLVKKAI